MNSLQCSSYERVGKTGSKVIENFLNISADFVQIIHCLYLHVEDEGFSCAYVHLLAHAVVGHQHE